MPKSPFELTDQAIKPTVDEHDDDELQRWWATLLEEGRAEKATQARQGHLSTTDIEALARDVFDKVQEQAANQGLVLPEEYLTRLIGELSGLGSLLALIARPDVEDIAINLGHIYIYTTGQGWEYATEAPPSVGDALRVLIDRAAQRPPSPDYPVSDAMLQVMVPVPGEGIRRKGLRINYIMPPASPYGDTITIRVSNYRTKEEYQQRKSLAFLCQSRLPPVKRPPFSPVDFPRGNGVITPEVANYLLAVMVHGGTMIVAGSTGSGKTFVSQRILQEMIDYYPPGALRLFIIEDSNEIVLNGWDGDKKSDTGNIVYAVTRPAIIGGPPAVTMYDLIRAALRSRPHGVVIGEARGPEAWELVRAASTGHGHSAFTIHATSAEHVWPRFLQVVQSHPDAQRMSEAQIAQGFAEAVTTIVYIERDYHYGQMVREVVEVSPIVEKTAGRPTFSPLFRFDADTQSLQPTGNRPMRPGFRTSELNLLEGMFSKNGHAL